MIAVAAASFYKRGQQFPHLLGNSLKNVRGFFKKNEPIRVSRRPEFSNV